MMTTGDNVCNRRLKALTKTRTNNNLKKKAVDSVEKGALGSV